MASKSSSRASNATSRSQRIGVIGLGLMGQGIVACLLAHGHDVVGLDNDTKKAEETVTHAAAVLPELKRRKLMSAAAWIGWRKRFKSVLNLRDLKGCDIVLECVGEDLALKRSIFVELDKIVSQRTIVASNTSSIPISLLQAGRVKPERYIGMHWGEPAQIMRYLEIIPGKQTSKATVQRSLKFGIACGKEPAVLKQDIRGFLSNRMMYAMLREACYLVEAGIADVETVDQSFRNDMGWWALLAGPFRWMDLTGIPAYATVMEGVFPELSNAPNVPEMMKKMVKRSAHGIANQKGFYPYTKAEAKEWEQKWEQFTYEMRTIAERYTPTK